MDALFELDKWIEERVYDKYEPIADDGQLLFSWCKESNGRYAYWDSEYGTRSYYISEIWPRHFSTNTLLSVDLAKKFRISIKPVVNQLSNEVCGYCVESSLMSNVSVVKETLEEAICLLVVMLTKNLEVKNV